MPGLKYSTLWTLWIMKNMPSLCNIGIRIHSNSTQCKVHSGDEDLSINGGGLRSFFACMAEMHRHKCLCPFLFQCFTWQFVLQYQAALQPPQTLKGLSFVPALWQITGAHTNGIERQWRPLKEDFRRGHHVTLGKFDRHLHCWRYRHQLHMDGMRFDRIYDDIVQCLT